MSDERIIDLLAKTFGSNKRIERVLPNRKKMYRWGTSGTTKVPEIINKVYPYLIVKKPMAKIVLQFCKHKKANSFKNKYNKLPDEELQRREELYLQVRKLNAVGAAATTKSNDTRECEAIV